MKNVYFKWLLLLVIPLYCSSFFFSCSTPKEKPRVYDCFLFFNEIDLLLIRLQEMSPYVDQFVIVEANETFRGTPKPFNFQENKHLFQPFLEKITYIPLEERLDTNDPWDRERFQRAQIKQGLNACKPNDIILLSDLDEIVRGSCIPHILDSLYSGKAEAVVCNQKMYYAYLNRYWDQWSGSVATTYKRVKKIDVKTLRKLRKGKPKTLKRAKISRVHFLQDAGWHFTTLGGIKTHVKKVESYSHTEFDRAEFKTEGYFTERVKGMKLVSVDETFPQCIQDHYEELKSKGFIDSEEK